MIPKVIQLMKMKIIGTGHTTSVLDLLAASCKGVNCQRSIAFTFAPWVISNSVTYILYYIRISIDILIGIS